MVAGPGRYINLIITFVMWRTFFTYSNHVLILTVRVTSVLVLPLSRPMHSLMPVPGVEDPGVTVSHVLRLAVPCKRGVAPNASLPHQRAVLVTAHGTP